MSSFNFCLSMVLIGFISANVNAQTRSESVSGGDAPALTNAPQMSPSKPNVVKTCSTRIPALEKNQSPTDMKVEIIDIGGKLSSKITQAGITRDDNAKKNDFPVREMLSKDADRERLKLNEGESLIVHAMMMTSSPDMKGIMSVGKINLKNVRSVTTYQFGVDESAMNPIGSTTLVEAKDAKGKVLGTFLGGFMVTPCK